MISRHALIACGWIALGVWGSAEALAGTWSTENSMPTARSAPASGIINGTVFIAGGSIADGTPTAALEAFNPMTNGWTSRTSMSTARSDLGAGVVDGVLYAVGGCAGFEPCGLDVVEAYDP